MAEDQDQKTEQPTSKRLQEAAEKGNLPFSREVSNFFMMVVLAFTVGAFAPNMLTNSKILLTPFIIQPDAMPADRDGIGLLLNDILWKSLAIIALPVLFVIAAAFASRYMQSGFTLSWETLSPKWSKISPIEGIKRLFSLRTVTELIKSVFKLILVGTVAFLAVYPEFPHIKQLPDSSIISMLMFLAHLASNMIIGVAIAMFFIALFDYAFQRFQYYKSLRMTKQEVKDEHKQMEGDPKIKGRLRKLRMEKAMKRMMANVPTSDVVITNPTHFAIALKYDQATMQAPTVVAKGQDLIALKIREVAQENGVPVVENPPLARALFDTAELEEEIPVKHYEAVAKIISYVYQLKGKK